MKRVLLILAFGICIVSCADKAMTPEKLVNDILESTRKSSSITYEIDYKIKYFSDIEDTTKLSAKVDLIRIPSDTILGGIVWIKSDSIDKYYNTNFLYLIDHKKQKITRYAKDKPYPITGNTIGSTVKIHYLDTLRLMNYLIDSTTSVKLSSDQLLENDTWKLSFKYADDEYVENSWKNIWIDKSTNQILKMNFSADMQGENQYNQWDLTDIQHDRITVEDLENRLATVVQKYQVIDSEQKLEEPTKALENGSLFPRMEGTSYSDKKNVSLSDPSAKLTLYDFWYMDCFPCIKAIPHLNLIYSKHQSNGLQVIGVNPLDNNEKDLQRLPNFLDHNQIDYPILFIDRAQAEKLQVTAYPTFYLVDHKGIILHSEVGHDEKTSAKIDSIIEVHL